MKRRLLNHLSLVAGCVVLLCTILVGCKSQKRNNLYSGNHYVVYPEAKSNVYKYTADLSPDDPIIKKGIRTYQCQYAAIEDSIGWHITINYDSLMTIKAYVDPDTNILYYAEFESDTMIYAYDSDTDMLDSDEFWYIHDKISPVLVLISRDSLAGIYEIAYQWEVKAPTNDESLFEIYMDEISPLTSDIPTFAIYANIDTAGRVTHYSNNQWHTFYEKWEWKDYYENRIRWNLDPVIADLAEEDTL